MKHVTEHLGVVDPGTSEEFHLRSHAATDLARLHFCGTCAAASVLPRRGGTGIALVVTNVPPVWREPSERVTRDAEFRIHAGWNVGGESTWGSGDHPPNDLVLDGTHARDWHPCSRLGGRFGLFRWLAVEVGPAPS